MSLSAKGSKGDATSSANDNNGDAKTIEATDLHVTTGGMKSYTKNLVDQGLMHFQIKKNLEEAMKLEDFTEVQRRALDISLEKDEDMLVIAPTGQGKTLAYALVMHSLISKGYAEAGIL